MARLYLARHGETAWNAIGRLQGTTDIPLNEAGLAQAAALAERLRGERLLHVTTSDLSRARETGATVVTALGLDPLTTDVELRERRFGKFEGLTYEEAAARYPEEWKAWTDHAILPAGAEDRDDVVARMGRALTRVAARLTDRAALVVSHGGAIRLWLKYALGLPVPQRIGNGAIFVVEHGGGLFQAAPWEP